MQAEGPDPRPLRILLLFLLLWTGGFSALEVYRTIKLYINRPWTEEEPSAWRLGCQPLQHLEAFLNAAGEVVPAGSRVLFSYRPAVDQAEATYAFRWAAYLMPRHLILPEAGADGGEYWIVYGERLDPPGAETVWESEAGTVYRLMQ